MTYAGFVLSVLIEIFLQICLQQTYLLHMVIILHGEFLIYLIQKYHFIFLQIDIRVN